MNVITLNFEHGLSSKMQEENPQIRRSPGLRVLLNYTSVPSLRSGHPWGHLSNKFRHGLLSGAFREGKCDAPHIKVHFAM